MATILNQNIINIIKSLTIFLLFIVYLSPVEEGLDVVLELDLSVDGCEGIFYVV